MPERPSDLQSRAREDLLDFYDDALRVLKDSVSATKVYRAKCPNPKCGRDVNIKYPDITAVRQALEWMWDRGVGKPSEAPKPPRVPSVTDLSAMSDAELQAWLDAADDEFLAAGALGAGQEGAAAQAGAAGPAVPGVADDGGGSA